MARNVHPAERGTRARRCVRAFSARCAGRDRSFGPSSCVGSRRQMQKCGTLAHLCGIPAGSRRSMSKEPVAFGGNGRSNCFCFSKRISNAIQGGARNITLELQRSKVKETESCIVFFAYCQAKFRKVGCATM